MNEKATYRELEFRIKELEEQLAFVKKKAQIAKEAKIELMANMSHEPRTPIWTASEAKSNRFDPNGTSRAKTGCLRPVANLRGF